MNVTKLNCDIKDFIGILHVADIHIRLTKRHEEYLSVFKKLYEVAYKTPPNTCIAVLGDIFHSKSDLSPECVKLASDFLKTLADIRPTVVIAGNHDATLNNKSRLDSISPIIDALQHKNLFYLKDTGLFILGDILFNHMSVFDSMENYIKSSDIPNIYRNQTRHLVGLFHGSIHMAITDMGYYVSNSLIKPELFEDHDLVLVGDIHKHQVLETPKSKTKIVYPGSLIQQNHGEELSGHGYVMWNLTQRAFRQLDINNEYGFYTIDVNKGKLTTDLSNLPKKSRLRVRCFESVASEVKSIVSKIKENNNIDEITYIRVDADQNVSKNLINSTSLKLSDLSSVDYQNQLIKSFLKRQYPNENISDTVFDSIFEINKYYNQNIDRDKLARNIRWKPKKFEFSNMFSYGENNVIDFSKMKNTVGLFASNASGKSSILSALSFCIYDKCDRAFKASHILNSQKTSFSCKFNFEIDKIDYFIERVGKSDKKGNVKVDVRFWKEEDKKIIELNGEARRSTNDVIRDYLGSYEDFILTTLSIQNNKSGTFVDMGQTERKDLISQFMGINIFDMLYQKSSDCLKELSLELKSLNKDTDQNVVNNMEIDLENLKINLKRVQDKIELLNKRKQIENENLLEETKKLIKLDISIHTNATELESENKNLSDSISKLKSEKMLNEDKLLNLSKEKETLELEIKRIEDSEIVGKYQQFIDTKNKLSIIKHEIEKKKIFVTSKLEKIQKLKSHQYDPNCKYCTNNSFVRDAMDAQTSLSQDKIDTDELIKKYNELNVQFENLNNISDLYESYSLLKKNKLKIETEYSLLVNNILKLDNKIQSFESKLVKVVVDLKNYLEQESNIKHNQLVESNIKNISGIIKAVDNDLRQNTDELVSLSSKVATFENDLLYKKSSINKVKDIQKKIDVYTLYVQSVSRDGIPFELITNAAPIIEKEVNSILTQIVEFSVNIQTDGKNVMTYLVYNDKKWALELSSGLEKFLTSLAIRVALINISNLPRPNFMAVDEGWGTMDGTNLSSVSSLFSILKNSFDFILIISHIDSMKDVVDNHLEINKIDGFSSVKFT